MKVCIAGAGAIGGLIGTRLARSGVCQVSALARGATLAALRDQGWRLIGAQGPEHAPARASDSAHDLGVQDLVVIAVKAPALRTLAPSLAPLIGERTAVLPAMNGVPWWFCREVSGFGAAPLASVDPGGVIEGAIAFPRVLGGVVHMAAASPEPGLVRHQHGLGLIVGEPLGGLSDRVAQVVQCLSQAGFEARASADVRRDTWYKLWGNLTMNPVSALTGATVDRILADPLVRDFCSLAMREAQAVGERIGCPIDQTPQQRHEVTARLGAFRTSMLQDVQAGRPLELDAIVSAVREIGHRVGLATPAIDGLLGLTRLFAQTRGLYPVG